LAAIIVAAPAWRCIEQRSETGADRVLRGQEPATQREPKLQVLRPGQRGEMWGIRRLARSDGSLRMLKAQRSQIQAVDEGINRAHRIIRGHVIINARRQQHGLITRQSVFIMSAHAAPCFASIGLASI